MSKRVESKVFFGSCKCCLKDGFHKNMWSEYFYNEETEIYGVMLTGCFAITWERADQVELICDKCIKQLRASWAFKEQFLMCEKALFEQSEVIKSETDNEKEISRSMMFEEGYDSSPDSSSHEVKVEVKEEPSSIIWEQSDEEIMEIEFLEDDDKNEYTDIAAMEEMDETTPTSQTVDSATPKTDVATAEKPKRKWPKKKKKGEKTRRYRNYSDKQLEDALKAIKAKKMTLLQASLKFDIPKKTLAYKSVDKTKNDSAVKREEQIKHQRFIKDMKNILKYTNATPYKSTYSKYYCPYCVSPEHYEEPDDLRDHVRRKHAANQMKCIDILMRPIWSNEIMKLDIYNLQCLVCKYPIKSWNDMFVHLQEVHSVELEEAYTRAIPYSLSSDHGCALCNEKFQNYHLLDAHMNAHYNNFLCPDCGDSFLCNSRLSKHVLIHDVGQFPCDVCGKVFALEKYMKKHVIYSHTSNSVKCHYCDERFHGEYQRHLHVLDNHKNKVKPLTCELCGLVFYWRPYYLKHLKREHDTQQFNCKYCTKQFHSRSELRKHRATHSGQKQHRCNICDKRYSSLVWLRQHIRTHDEVNKATIIIVKEKKKDETEEQ